MTTQRPINTPTNLREWLEFNHELIEKLKNRDLTKEETKAFYERITQDNIFGLKIIFRVTNKTKIGDGKVQITAHIMEMTENGLIGCKSPLSPNRDWEITAFFHGEVRVEEGELYESNYTYQSYREYRHQLLTIPSKDISPLKVSFHDILLLNGGKSLASVAEQVFGTDLEAVLFSRFSEYRNSLFKDEIKKIETLKKKNEEAQKQLSIKEDSLKDELQKVQKDYENELSILKESYQKEISKQQIEHQKELNKLSSRDLQFYNILSKIHSKPKAREDEYYLKPILQWDPNTIVETLQTLFYCDREESLYYDKSVIETFLRALQTNTLVVLSGPSGTGKSSLVRAFTDAIQEATAHFISVQSSWTDKMDLFGYFNAIERSFVPTPFLDSLLAAKESNSLYLICLDEMNLAHVEYYFAEILSSQELNNPIPLYPPRYYEEAREFIDFYDCIDDPTTEDRKQYQNAKELLRYPYEIEIPSNVRFVGTINMDHTVKPLSPKVIDRCFIIELTQQSPSADEQTTLESSTLTGRIEIDLESFTTPISSEEDVKHDVEWLIECSDILQMIPNARLNSRGKKQLINYLRIGAHTSERTLNQLVLSKLLPRINFSKSQYPAATDAFESFTNRLREKKLKESAQRASQMYNDSRHVNFFK